MSRYHSNSARGSSSSAKKLTGANVADQIAATTSYEPMWHDTTSAPFPSARASSTYSHPVTFRSERIDSTLAVGSCIRSAYAFAWLRKFSFDRRRNSAGLLSISGQAIFRLYSSLGRASGANCHAILAASTASAYAHARGRRSTIACTILNARHVHSPIPQRLNIGRKAYHWSGRSLMNSWNRSTTRCIKPAFDSCPSIVKAGSRWT